MVRARRYTVFGWALGITLFLALVFLVHFSVGWAAVLSPWQSVPLASLATAFLLVLGSYVLRSIRVHRLFLPETAGDLLRVFRLTLIHNLFNNFLPMRSGEASFPILMKREFEVPFSRSIPGLFYLRLMDFHFLALLAAIVISVEKGGAAWAVASSLLPVPAVAFLLQERIRRVLDTSTGRLAGVARKGMEGLPRTPSVFWWTWLWTVVNWGVKLLVFAWILHVFAVISFGTALLGSITGEVSSVLPVHGVAGAGTYEAGVAMGLLPLGVDSETALRGGVNLHLFILSASILSGAIAFVLPVKPRKAPAPHPPGLDPRGEGRELS